MTGRGVLVTGATGFIGGHLVRRLLADGATVRALVRSPSSGLLPAQVEQARGDVRDADAVRAASAGCAIVFHLAGRSTEANGSEGSGEVAGINVEGTRRVVEAAARTGVGRIVFVSSVKAMGESTEGVADESVPPRPASAYGRSKLEGERLVLAAAEASRPEGVCLRLPPVYGPGQKGNLERLFGAVERGLFPPPPPRTGRRSLVHVGTVVEAACLAARHPKANRQVFIVADVALTARELYEAVCRAAGRRAFGWSIPLPVLAAMARAGDALGRLAGRPVPFDSEALRRLVDPAEFTAEKIRRDLSFEPRVDFANALREIAIAERKGAS